MTDVSVEGPRLARQEDFPHILDLVDRCFREPDGRMAAEWSHCYDVDKLERHAVVTRDGDVVSHASHVKDTLLIEGSELDCWGISGVATDPRHRGNGYMTQLIEFWVDRIDDADVPLATLGGKRQLYAGFGWEHAGLEQRYRVTERSLDADEYASEHVERYDGSDAAIDFIRTVHQTRPYRVRRKTENYRVRLGRGHLETVLYTESGSEAYLTFERAKRSGSITECGGSERGVRALLAFVLDTFETNSLECCLHPTESLNGFFGGADVTASWRSKPHRSINIRDLPAVVSAYTDLLTQRWRETESSCPDGSLTLAIAGDEQAVELVWTDTDTDTDVDVDVSSDAANPDLELGRRAMTRLLMGYPETVAEYDGHPFLDAVLPLDFYVPRTDHV